MADFNNNNNQLMYEREPAKRVFAAELREATETMRDTTDEKSPTYVLLPTGEKCNRILLCGAVTQRDKTGEQNVVYRARISDPTGVFYVSAGQYQPEAMAQLAQIDASNPCIAMVVGKPNVYETQDGKKLLSVRAESVQVVDGDTRAMWVLDAAKLTLDRIDALEKGASADAQLAREKYSFPAEHWRSM
ncbi:MAG TPA: nucleic acid-binding protein, partial [Methanocorpusculum sp.]|nr:nucleic acid-binding protein [Methanocorpusculum sp.]